MKIVGSKVYQHRINANVSRSELALASELTSARIGQIERSEISAVKESTVKRIAKKLKISIESLV